MKTMVHHKIELAAIFAGAFAGAFVNELFEKVIITSLAMIVGTTLAYYWKKYLEKKSR